MDETFIKFLPTPPIAEQQLQWFRDLGLDPVQIPLGSLVIVDPKERTVTVSYIVYDTDGRPQYNSVKEAWVTDKHTVKSLYDIPRYPDG